jgi:hypothetical protein
MSAGGVAAAEWRFRRHAVRQQIVADARPIGIGAVVVADSCPGIPQGWSPQLLADVRAGLISQRRARQIVAERQS